MPHTKRHSSSPQERWETACTRAERYRNLNEKLVVQEVVQEKVPEKGRKQLAVSAGAGKWGQVS